LGFSPNPGRSFWVTSLVVVLEVLRLLLFFALCCLLLPLVVVLVLVCSSLLCIIGTPVHPPLAHNPYAHVLIDYIRLVAWRTSFPTTILTPIPSGSYAPTHPFNPILSNPCPARSAGASGGGSSSCVGSRSLLVPRDPIASLLRAWWAAIGGDRQGGGWCVLLGHIIGGMLLCSDLSVWPTVIQSTLSLQALGAYAIAAIVIASPLSYSLTDFVLLINDCVVASLPPSLALPLSLSLSLSVLVVGVILLTLVARTRALCVCLGTQTCQKQKVSNSSFWVIPNVVKQAYCYDIVYVMLFALLPSVRESKRVSCWLHVLASSLLTLCWLQ
jgi:hypothetical protein